MDSRGELSWFACECLGSQNEEQKINTRERLSHMTFTTKLGVCFIDYMNDDAQEFKSFPINVTSLSSVL